MSSTVYLVDKGKLFGFDDEPFHKNWICSKMTYCFQKYSLTNSPRNEKTVSKNDKLWAAIEKIFEKQRRYMLTVMLDEVEPGAGISIRVLGPFLEKLRADYDDFAALKLKVTLCSGTKSWSIEINLNNFKKQKGILRIVQSPKSERVFRRVVALPGLVWTLKLTTKANAFLERRLLRDNLLKMKIRQDFHLIAENGTRIAFHKKLLAAHSRVFRCPTVQSLDALQLFVSEDALKAFETYVYKSILDDSQKEQRIVFEVLEMAHFYNIYGLESVLKKKLLAAFPGFVDLDIALLLYCFAKKIGVGYEELRKKAYNLIIRTPRSAITKTEAYKFIQNNDTILAMKIHNFGETVWKMKITRKEMKKTIALKVRRRVKR